MELNYRLHVFRSPRFQSVVEEAIDFFNNIPIHKLPPPTKFEGSGVYALYYSGDFELYARIANKKHNLPIYIGKAVPPGWRTARTQKMDAPTLYRRLREHDRSVKRATNLEIDDFECRFMILDGIESDLVVPIEAELIRSYKPLWNSVIDGFGNHDPGKGRYNQAKSEWDVLHPGRHWAERLMGEPPSLQEIIAKVDQFLSGLL